MGICSRSIRKITGLAGCERNILKRDWGVEVGSDCYRETTQANHMRIRTGLELENSSNYITSLLDRMPSPLRILVFRQKCCIMSIGVG